MLKQLSLVYMYLMWGFLCVVLLSLLDAVWPVPNLHVRNHRLLMQKAAPTKRAPTYQQSMTKALVQERVSLGLNPYLIPNPLFKGPLIRRYL